MREVDRIFNSIMEQQQTPAVTYTLYDYLESDSRGQWIDTGMPATDNTSFHLDISLTNRGNYSYIGNRVTSGRYFSLDQTNSGPIFTVRLNGVSQELPDLRPYGEWNKITIGKNIHIVHSGGTEYDYVLTPSEFTTNGNIYLFYANGGGGAYIAGRCRMKPVERYDSGGLTQILHPAVRDMDGVAGMLDLVNNVFHTNANPAGDNFSYGNLT